MGDSFTGQKIQPDNQQYRSTEGNFWITNLVTGGPQNSRIK